MQIREIEYVAAVAETGGFSKAAERLHVSQPALSQSIQRLEERLGVKLLNRALSPVRLTEAGGAFMEHGYEVLLARDMMLKKMSDLRDLKTGTLAVGISQFYGKYYISRLLPEFKRRHPGIRVNIVEELSSELEDQILKGKIDFGIFSLPIESPKIRHETIFEETLLLAAPPDHPLAAADGSLPKVDLRKFRNDDFVMLKEGQRLRTIVLELCRKAGFTPRIAFETQFLETANAFIAGGMGVGFIPDAIRRYSIPEHRAAYFRLRGGGASRTIVAAYHEDAYLSRPARACIDLAKQHLVDI